MTYLQKLTTTALIRALLVSVVFAAPVHAATEVVAVKSQLVTADIARTVVPGMTAQEVLAKIGPPERKMRFARTGTTSWDYSALDMAGSFGEFSVIFNDNEIIVSRILIRRDS